MDNNKINILGDRDMDTTVAVKINLPVDIQIYSGDTTIIELGIQNESSFDIENVMVKARIDNTFAVIQNFKAGIFTLPASDTLKIYLAATSSLSRPALTTLTADIYLPSGFSNKWTTEAKREVKVNPKDGLTVGQVVSSYHDQGDGNFLFNYKVVIGSKRNISKWQVTFQLENGSKLDPDWLGSQDWFDVEQSTTTGNSITLVSKSGKSIAPNYTFIDVSLLCPGNGPVFHVIHKLGFEEFAQ